jgi:predicted MFS family arabinose efflux permease
MSQDSKYLPFLMWSLPLLFFAFQFTLRLWPSLTMQEIMSRFSIDATSYGLLASVYYYGYAGMQIPIAIALDKYGPRVVLSFCAALCGIGMLIFSYTESWYIAVLSRFLIGIGSAGGFLITANVVSQCFESKNYGKMIGASFSIGLLGAVYGGKPLNLLLSAYGSAVVAQCLSFIAILISLISILFFKIKVKNDSEIKVFKIQNIVEILKSPTLILLAIVNLLMVGILEGFADVWGVNYLVTAFKIEKSLAAEVISFIFIGMLFGGPLLAFLSGKIGDFFSVALAGIIIAISSLYIILYSESFNSLLLSAICFCIGIMCCYQVLIITIGSKIANPSVLSITTAFLNCVNMLGGAFFHSIIGFGMDFFSSGLIVDGMYEVGAYQKALLIIPICSVLGSIITIMIKNLKR